MKKVLFIDRDGTLVKEPKDTFQVDCFEVLEFLPGVFTYLGKIIREMDYELVMVTNQDGLGTPSFPEETFWPVQNFIINAFENEAICFADVAIDKSFPHENKATRKPGTALLTKYFSSDYDLTNSVVIGDRLTDIKLAENLGCKSILIRNNEIPDDNSLVVETWEEVYKLLKKERKASLKRITKETNINISLNLDGTGKSSIQTGLKFFDHMLEQVARHGNIDLEIFAAGDLQIDEHHTIEDTAITLGETFSKALGDKRGIERYGFCLPMDDCLSQVAIDFGGRPWLVWEAEFNREKVGDMPTEMFMHFFKSFSDSAKCNLNIKAEGNNEHHKIESIFKCFAKAIRFAVQQNVDCSELPSTKGVL
jgi:imidazoleglycerol-phosphate dehydratase / histidinol-phosphatase